MRPAISVVIPNYNNGTYLRECVESCLSQSLDNIEVVIVDDGSEDESPELIKQIASEDPRARFHLCENQGAAAARNTGLDSVKGEFVFFLDSDDYVPEQTAFERLYRSAKTNGTKIAGGSMCLDRDGIIDFDSLHGAALDSFPDDRVLDYSDYQYDYDFTRYIYSVDMIREEGLRFPKLVQFEDPVFFVHAMLAAGRFSTIPDAVYAYRYGYQVARRWSEQMVLDRVAGISDLLEKSRENHLPKLHSHLVGQLDWEMMGAFLDNVGSRRVVAAMCAANALIDAKLLQENDPHFTEDFYLVEGLRRMSEAYVRRDQLKRSRLGRLLVWLKHRFSGNR